MRSTSQQYKHATRMPSEISRVLPRHHSRPRARRHRARRTSRIEAPLFALSAASTRTVSLQQGRNSTPQLVVFVTHFMTRKEHPWRCNGAARFSATLSPDCVFPASCAPKPLLDTLRNSAEHFTTQSMLDSTANGHSTAEGHTCPFDKAYSQDCTHWRQTPNVVNQIVKHMTKKSREKMQVLRLSKTRRTETWCRSLPKGEPSASGRGRHQTLERTLLARLTRPEVFGGTSAPPPFPPPRGSTSH